MSARYKKVLIIDDDEVDRLILRRTLLKSAVTEKVEEAESGMKALDLITAVGKKHTDFPELIFLDVNMPAMSGFQFLDTLSNLSHEYMTRCRVIFQCSVKDDKEEKKAFSYPNVIGYFLKPVSMHMLDGLDDSLHHSNAS